MTIKDVGEQAIKVVWGQLRRLRTLRTLTLRKLANPYVLEDPLCVFFTHKIVDREFKGLGSDAEFGFVGTNNRGEVAMALRTVPFLYLIQDAIGQPKRRLRMKGFKGVADALLAIKVAVRIQARYNIPYGVLFGATWANSNTLKLLTAYLPRNRHRLMTAVIWDEGKPLIYAVANGVVTPYSLNPTCALNDASLDSWVKDVALELILNEPQGGDKK
jgi:hypothetical protein